MINIFFIPRLRFSICVFSLIGSKYHLLYSYGGGGGGLAKVIQYSTERHIIIQQIQMHSQASFTAEYSATSDSGILWSDDD